MPSPNMSMEDLVRLEQTRRALLTDAERIAEDTAKSDYTNAYMQTSEKLQELLNELGLGRD
jgi:hypothetical protein